MRYYYNCDDEGHSWAFVGYDGPIAHYRCRFCNAEMA